MKNAPFLSLSLVGIGILVGLIISFQIFSPVPYVENPWGSMSDLNDTIQILNTSHQRLQTQISDMRSRVTSIESAAADSSTFAKLDSVKKEAGLTEVKGSGIRVVIDINYDAYFAQNPDSDYCFAADLRDLVNIMKAAGAEGISINGQRIIMKTPISCFGSTVLLNNLRFLPPYTIKAVGPDQNKFISYLSTKKYLENLNEKIDAGWVNFTYSLEDSITIPIYSGSITPNFIE
jgi:uncharacterized protein YlxW (UPF0749 family)